MFDLTITEFIIVLVVSIPGGFLLSYFIPFRGLSTYEWKSHARKMNYIYNLSKRAQKLNKGIVDPAPGNEEETFFSSCTPSQMYFKLAQIADQYEGAYLMAQTFRYEARALRADGVYYQTELGEDGFTVVTHNTAAPKKAASLPKTEPEKAYELEQQAVEVIDLSPEITTEEGRKALAPGVAY